MGIPDDYEPKVAKKKPGKGFEPLPEDTYEVVISKLELRKDQPIYQSSEVEDRYNFEFTVVEEGEYKGRKLWKDVRPVMSAAFEGGMASFLYKIFCAVNQVKLSDEEAKLVKVPTINALEGKPLRLVVKQKPKLDGTTKNVVADVLATKNTTGTPIVHPTTVGKIDDLLKTVKGNKPPDDDIVVEDGDLPF